MLLQQMVAQARYRHMAVNKHRRRGNKPDTHLLLLSLLSLLSLLLLLRPALSLCVMGKAERCRTMSLLFATSQPVWQMCFYFPISTFYCFSHQSSKRNNFYANQMMGGGLQCFHRSSLIRYSNIYQKRGNLAYDDSNIVHKDEQLCSQSNGQA